MPFPTSTTILIVGAGPAGLACAVALLVHGFKDFLIVDVRPDAVRRHSRALAVHARTLELLDTIGCSDALHERGIPMPSMHIHSSSGRLLIGPDASRLPSKYKYVLTVPQSDTEEVLYERLKELGGEVVFGKKACGMSDAEGDKVVRFESGEDVRATWVIGADGSHSVIRTLAGVPFIDPTSSSSTSVERFVLADIHCSSSASFSLLPSTSFFSAYLNPAGVALWIPLRSGLIRVVARVTQPDAPAEPDKAYMQSIVSSRYPGSPIVEDILWSSRFEIRYRIADTFCKLSMGGKGGVLLVGDAAHVHSPAGGQGMNLGVRDAITLASILSSSPSPPALSKWAASRRKAGLSGIAVAHNMTRMATIRPGIRSWVRDWVLWCVGCVPWVRRRILYNLSGIAERAGT